MSSSGAATAAATLSGAFGVRTRAQKRRIGERDVWSLIVNNDDICFKHILPRLNRTDLKFLYGVNTETRKLIKRSSRAGDLKEKFKVREMSSISTLEFAWENKSLWSGFYLYDERSFCEKVAHTNKLELLKWAREEKECDWDEKTISTAAEQGNLEMIKYCVANECPIDEDACARAAQNGHLEVLKYLREEVKATWDSRTASWAAAKGHLHILEYLVERKYDQYRVYACAYAAENGHLDCLKHLHETAKAPWDSDAVRYAHKNNHTECVQYLLNNDCPLPPGWRYEDGESSNNSKIRFQSPKMIKAMGVVDDVMQAIEQNKKDVSRRERMKFASPPGVPQPPIVPVIEPGKFGFVDNAETMNSRASMIGWWSLLLVELVAGKGLLELLGFTVGKGINFTF
ncbi:unnamed protein product [Bathycoccus prasinos]